VLSSTIFYRVDSNKGSSYALEHSRGNSTVPKAAYGDFALRTQKAPRSKELKINPVPSLPIPAENPFFTSANDSFMWSLSVRLFCFKQGHIPFFSTITDAPPIGQ